MCLHHFCFKVFWWHVEDICPIFDPWGLVSVGIKQLEGGLLNNKYFYKLVMTSTVIPMDNKFVNWSYNHMTYMCFSDHCTNMLVMNKLWHTNKPTLCLHGYPIQWHCRPHICGGLLSHLAGRIKFNLIGLYASESWDIAKIPPRNLYRLVEASVPLWPAARSWHVYFCTLSTRQTPQKISFLKICLEIYLFQINLFGQ